MEMELLALKVEVIEKTLATFQKEVEQKLKVVEQFLSSRTEQFAAQKFFMEKEELLHRSLWNSWGKCDRDAKEKEVQVNERPAHFRSAEFQPQPQRARVIPGHGRVTITPMQSPLSTISTYAQERTQSQIQRHDRRGSSPRSEGSRHNNADPALRHFENSNRITVTTIPVRAIPGADPLGTSDAGATYQSRRDSTSEKGEDEDMIITSSPIISTHQDNELEYARSSSTNSGAGNAQKADQTPNEHDIDNEEEEEVQVLEMKFSVTAKEGIIEDTPQVSSSANNNHSQARSGPSRYGRSQLIQPNLEILPYPGPARSRPVGSTTPATTNVYSMLRNKYIHKRTNANSAYQNAQFGQHFLYQNQPMQFNQPARTTSLHQRRQVHSASGEPSSSTVTPRRSYHPCGDCGKAFSKADALKKHREEQVCSKCFECAVCDPSTTPTQYFNEYGEVEAHMFSVHKLKKFRVCQFCRKCFGPFRGLLEHQLEYHREQAAKEASKFKHRCMLCSKTYSTRNDLICHSRVHTGERPFSCGACDRTFADARNMRKHQVICHQKQYSNYNSSSNSLIQMTDDNT